MINSKEEVEEGTTENRNVDGSGEDSMNAEEKKDEKIIILPAAVVSSTSNNVLIVDTIIKQPRSSSSSVVVVHEKKNEKVKLQATTTRNKIHPKKDKDKSMMEKKRIEQIIKYSSTCTAERSSLLSSSMMTTTVSLASVPSGAPCVSLSGKSSFDPSNNEPPTTMMTTGLDRQRAGYVQPEPGAYSIPGIAEYENNNNNVSSFEASSFNTTIPDATSTNASSLSTTTALMTATVSTVDRSSLDNPPHYVGRGHRNNTRGGSSGDRLIEAELVTAPICATEVVPIDEETRRKMKKKKG
jgi:hypothetical protein